MYCLHLLKNDEVLELVEHSVVRAVLFLTAFLVERILISFHFLV